MTGEPSLWRLAWFEVLVGAALGAALGAAIGGVWPNIGVALKPCTDAFVALIELSIPPLIFMVIVTSIAQVGDLRKIGRLGLKALIYFEVVSTIGLLLGALVGNIVIDRPLGQGAHKGSLPFPRRQVDPARLQLSRNGRLWNVGRLFMLLRKSLVLLI